MFRRLFARNRRNESIAYSLYGTIVAQARQPVFYRDLDVPDTIDGRFDMIILHSFLLFHRLKRETPDDRLMGQAVFDIFLKDMDGTLREMGVGDVSVPKKLKKMAEAFYGRVSAYDAAVDSGDLDALSDALSRNVFPEIDAGASARRIATYMQAAVARLAAQDLSAIREGHLEFPPLTVATTSEAA